VANSFTEILDRPAAPRAGGSFTEIATAGGPAASFSDILAGPSQPETPAGERGFFGNIAESYRRGRKGMELDQAVYAARFEGVGDPVAARQARAEQQQREAADPIEGNFFSKFIYGPANILPGMIAGPKEALPLATAGAVGAAGMAALAGQAGPQVAIPEEIVTVPGAAVLGFKTGMAMGSTRYWFKQGAGAMYADMVDQGYDDEVSAMAAQIGAIPYALIELAQVKAVTPGVRTGARKVLQKSVLKALKAAGKRYGATWATEVGEEVVQEATLIATEDVARFLSGKGSAVNAEDLKKHAERLTMTGLESARSMALLPAPGAAVDVAVDVRANRQQAQAAESQRQFDAAAFGQAIQEALEAHQVQTEQGKSLSETRSTELNAAASGSETRPVAKHDRTPNAAQQRTALAEVDRALAAGETDAGTAALARHLLTEVDPDFDANSSLEISALAQQATADIVEREGLPQTDPETGETIRYDIAGRTTTDRGTPDAQGSPGSSALRTAVQLYRGHDVDTLVEEWYHRAWDRLAALRPSDRAAFEQYHSQRGDRRSVGEHFAQEGRDYFFSNKLHEQAGPIRALFERARQSLGALIRRVRGLRGARIPARISELYQQAGTPRPKAHTETPFDAPGSTPAAETTQGSTQARPEVAKATPNVAPSAKKGSVWERMPLAQVEAQAKHGVIGAMTELRRRRGETAPEVAKADKGIHDPVTDAQWQAMIEEGELQHKAAQARLERWKQEAAGATTVRLDGPDGKYAMITPSAKEAGKWQITKFDTRGPWEDRTARSLNEALEEMSGVKQLAADFTDGEVYRITDMVGSVRDASDAQGSGSKGETTPTPATVDHVADAGKKVVATTKPAAREAQEPLPRTDEVQTEGTFPLAEVTKAYRHISMDPRRAALAEEGQFEQVTGAFRETLGKHLSGEALAQATERFRKGYLQARRAVWRARESGMSAAVAGASKFNSKQAGQRNRGIEAAEERFTATVNRLRRQIYRETGAQESMDRQAQERQEVKARAREAVEGRLQQQLESIEVGDRIDVGGRTPLTVVKVNKKTVVTDGGTKWTAGEIGRVIKKETEAKGRALFNAEQLAEFDRLGMDVAAVPATYKEDALQQLAFQQAHEKDLATPGYNERVRAEYAEQKRRRRQPVEGAFGPPAGPRRHKPAAPKTAQRVKALRQLAAKLDNQIDAKRHPAIAQQNTTARRARIAAGMAQDADRLEEIQQALNGIADALEAGTLPESLAGVSQRGQVEALRRRDYPRPWTGPSIISDLFKELKGKPGVAPLREALRHKAGGDLTIEQAATVKKLLALARKHKISKTYLNVSIDDALRLQRAGIETEADWKQAKEDLASMVKGPSAEVLAERKQKELEDKLIGTKLAGFFPTPRPVIERMLEEAQIHPGDTVLEPSAGKGDIADMIRQEHPEADLSVVEYAGQLRELLEAKGYELADSDFLEHQGRYDRIVMNPPFEKGQDAEHVRHAYELLNPGGRLVAIMSPGPFQRQTAKDKAFREWFDDQDVMADEDLPAGSFTGSDSFRQTSVATKLVVIDKGPNEWTAAEREAQAQDKRARHEEIVTAAQTYMAQTGPVYVRSQTGAIELTDPGHIKVGNDGLIHTRDRGRKGNWITLAPGQVNDIARQAGFDESDKPASEAAKTGTAAGSAQPAGRREAPPVELGEPGRLDKYRALKETAIARVSGERDAAVYKLVEAADVVASHDPHTFAVNEGYPAGVQERLYHSDRAEQMKVIENAKRFEPAFVVSDNPDAINGPPIVTDRGIVLGGNSRAMTIARVYRDNVAGSEAYRAMLRDKAQQFGIEPAQLSSMSEPVLVRQVLEGPTEAGAIRRMVSEYNKAFTQGLSTAAEAVSRARQIEPKTLAGIGNLLGMTESTTLRQLLGRPGDSQAILKELLLDQAISQQEVNKYLDPRTQLLNDEGKTLIENMLLGAVLPDADLLSNIPPFAQVKLEKSLAPLAEIRGGLAEWDISDDLAEAVAALSRWDKAKQKTVDDYLSQGDLFAEDAGPAKANPRAEAILRMIDGWKALEIKEALTRYSRDMRIAKEAQSQATFEWSEKAKSQHEAFEEHFSRPPVKDATADLFAAPVVHHQLRGEGQLSPALRALHNHPARVRGLDAVSDSQARAYFKALVRLAEARKRDDLVEKIEYAEDAYFEEKYDFAIRASEGALGYLHMDELWEAGDAKRAVESVMDPAVLFGERSVHHQLRRQASLAYQAARKSEGSFRREGMGIARQVAGRFLPGPPKLVKRVVEKVRTKRKERPSYAVGSIKDHLRGMIEVAGPAEAPAAIRALQAAGYTVEVMVDRPMNKFGYRGVNSSRRLPSGINGELQLAFADPAWKKARRDAHPYYSQWRPYEADKKAWAALSLSQKRQFYIAARKCRAIWQAYWGKIPADLIEAISAAGRSGASMALTTSSLSSSSTQSPSTSSNMPSGRNQVTRPSSERPTTRSSLSKTGSASSASNVPIGDTSISSIAQNGPKVQQKAGATHYQLRRRQEGDRQGLEQWHQLRRFTNEWAPPASEQAKHDPAAIEEKIVEYLSGQGGRGQGPRRPAASLGETPGPAEIEKLWNQWWAERDLEVTSIQMATGRLQKELLAAMGIKKLTSKNVDQVRHMDEALQLYIDLYNKPAQISAWWDELTDEQRALVQESQNLPAAVKAFGDRLIKLNKQHGLAKLAAGMIRNVVNYYTMRIWGAEAGQVRKGRKYRHQRFEQTTQRAEPRQYASILQGWADGRELKVKGATCAYELAHSQSAQALADRNFVAAAQKMGVFKGRESAGEDWVMLEHPHLGQWRQVAEMASDVEDWQSDNFMILPEDAGAKAALEWTPLYAPPELAKKLNNALGKSKLEGKAWKWLTKWNVILKNNVLFTSLFHHQAFLRSYMLGGQTGLRGLNVAEAYRQGRAALEQLEGEAAELVAAGLTIGRQQEWDERVWQEETTAIGRMIDRIPGAAQVKGRIMAFRETQNNFLFRKLGPYLKMQTALLEYRHLQQKYRKQIEADTISREDLARQAANIINDDFGGLHLQRMGRNPTTQHLMRLALLAPDWTESNVRSMVKAFKAGKGGALYRSFWGRILFKGLVATVLSNLMLSAFDDDDFWERYRKAWRSGHLKWLDVDVTPIYRGLGGQSPHRKYFSILGHFKDPLKFLAHPVTSLKHKSSIVGKIAFEAVSGTNWEGRQFTSFSELVGIDDKGRYKTSRKGHHRKGDRKGGRLTGQVVKWSPSGAKPLQYQQVPSFVLGQTRGLMPIQVQNAIAWLAGEIDAWDAITKSMGLYTTRAWQEDTNSKKKKRRR